MCECRCRTGLGTVILCQYHKCIITQMMNSFSCDGKSLMRLMYETILKHSVASYPSIAMSFRDNDDDGPDDRRHHRRVPRGPHRGRVTGGVKRSLFGPVDHEQTRADLEREMQSQRDYDTQKYNYNFSTEEPIEVSDPRFEWSLKSGDNTECNNNNEHNKSTNISKPDDCAVTTLPSGKISLYESSSTVTSSTDEQMVSPSVCAESSTSVTPSPTNVQPSPDTHTDGGEPFPSETSIFTSPIVSLEPTSGPSDEKAHATGGDANRNNRGKPTKQSAITDYMQRRKSDDRQRKRESIAKHSDEQTQTKRLRSDHTSAVEGESEGSDHREHP